LRSVAQLGGPVPRIGRGTACRSHPGDTGGGGGGGQTRNDGGHLLLLCLSVGRNGRDAQCLCRL
jgi:hypothetical protein